MALQKRSLGHCEFGVWAEQRGDIPVDWSDLKFCCLSDASGRRDLGGFWGLDV